MEKCGKIRVGGSNPSSVCNLSFAGLISLVLLLRCMIQQLKAGGDRNCYGGVY